MAKKNYIAGVWNDLLNVSYISPSPGVQYRYQMPATKRADNDPALNQQPWYHGSNFARVDPSQGLELRAQGGKKK